MITGVEHYTLIQSSMYDPINHNLLLYFRQQSHKSKNNLFCGTKFPITFYIFRLLLIISCDIGNKHILHQKPLLKIIP